MRDRLIELPIDDAILILKEEHKQRVDGYTTHLSYGGKGDSAEEVSLAALEMAISALEQTKWISVEDRLPDESGTYLVHYHDDIVGEYVTTRLFYGTKFHPMEYFEEHTGRKAMHWMPLPQPPKGK